MATSMDFTKVERELKHAISSADDNARALAENEVLPVNSPTVYNVVVTEWLPTMVKLRCVCVRMC